MSRFSQYRTLRLVDGDDHSILSGCFRPEADEAKARLPPRNDE